MALSHFSKFPKWARILLVLVMAGSVLLITGWAGNYLQSARAGDYITGKTYQGTVKYLIDARIGRNRHRETDRIAVVEANDKREILVSDLAGRLEDCESEDIISYRMEESALKGVEFVYIQGSCREP